MCDRMPVNYTLKCLFSISVGSNGCNTCIFFHATLASMKPRVVVSLHVHKLFDKIPMWFFFFFLVILGVIIHGDW